MATESVISTLAWNNGTSDFDQDVPMPSLNGPASPGDTFTVEFESIQAPDLASVFTADGEFASLFTPGTVYTLADDSDLEGTFNSTSPTDYELSDSITFSFDLNNDPTTGEVKFTLSPGAQFVLEQDGGVEFELSENTPVQGTWEIEGEPEPITARDVEFTFGQTPDSSGGGYQIQANYEIPPVVPPGFEKKINSEVNTTIKFDTDINFKKDKDVDINVKSQSDVDGNLAELVLDAEALGINTLVEVDTSILTVEEKLSSVVLSAISSSDPKDMGAPVPPGDGGQDPTIPEPVAA